MSALHHCGIVEERGVDPLEPMLQASVAARRLPHSGWDWTRTSIPEGTDLQSAVPRLSAPPIRELSVSIDLASPRYRLGASPLMLREQERNTGLEPVSSGWKPEAIAATPIPHISACPFDTLFSCSIYHSLYFLPCMSASENRSLDKSISDLKPCHCMDFHLSDRPRDESEAHSMCHCHKSRTDVL